MKTVICDIDGTLTSLWPIEKKILSCLLPLDQLAKIEVLKQSGMTETYKIYKEIIPRHITKSQYLKKYNDMFEELRQQKLLPSLEKFSLVDWILAHPEYTYVYATGGQKAESLYALQELSILHLFDIKNSVDKTDCPFSKNTGIPFRRILRKYSDCVLITDSESDCLGAQKVGLPFFLIRSGFNEDINKTLSLRVWLEQLSQVSCFN